LNELRLRGNAPGLCTVHRNNGVAVNRVALRGAHSEQAAAGQMVRMENADIQGLEAPRHFGRQEEQNNLAATTEFHDLDRE